MDRIKSNIKVRSEEGGNFAYFLEKEELYSRLSDIKDNLGNDIEFMEIGENILLDNQMLKVIDINLKFENIHSNIKHNDKTEISTPKNLMNCKLKPYIIYCWLLAYLRKPSRTFLVGNYLLN